MLILPAWLLAHGTLCKLTLVDAPVLTVDPACATCDGGSVVLQFRNDGPTKVALALTASEVVNAAGKRSNGKVVLKTVADLPGKTEVQTKEVSPGEFVYVRVDVQNVLQDGDWEFEIHNHGTKIGVFKVTRAPVPFTVKLDVPDPDAAEVSLQKCAPKLLSLKNDDDRPYPVSWEFAIDGQKAQATNPPPGRDETHGDTGLTLPAHGSGQFFLTPPGAWFGWRTILKDDTADGRLTVRLRRLACAAEGCEPSPDAPSKTFKIKAHLAYVSKNWQEFWADGFVLSAILAGAVVSFMANLLLPNYFRRRDLRHNLSQMEARISSLPMALASRLRVVASIERKSLDEALRSLAFYSLEFKSRIAGLEQDAKQLSSRVDLLEKMGTDRIRFEALRASAPPTLVDDIEDLFEDTIRTLEVVGLTDPALDSAKAKATEIEKHMDDLQKPSTEFGSQLGGPCQAADHGVCRRQSQSDRRVRHL